MWPGMKDDGTSLVAEVMDLGPNSEQWRCSLRLRCDELCISCRDGGSFGEHVAVTGSCAEARECGVHPSAFAAMVLPNIHAVTRGENITVIFVTDLQSDGGQVPTPSPGDQPHAPQLLDICQFARAVDADGVAWHSAPQTA